MKYIVVEGMDLSGKTTLCKKIGKSLKGRVVSEPFTETSCGERVKKLVCGNDLSKPYELMLYIGQRIEAYSKVVIKYLTNGRIVISDRSVISTMVYQENKQFSLEKILKINDGVLETIGCLPIPTHIFFLDISYDEYICRCDKADWELDNKEMELKNKEIFEKRVAKFKKALGIYKTKYPNVKINFITPETTVDEIINIVG